MAMVRVAPFFLTHGVECGPMPNVMVALPNIGGVVCSTPQTLPDAHCRCVVCWSVCRVVILCVVMFCLCVCLFSAGLADLNRASSRVVYCGHSTQYSHLVFILLLLYYPVFCCYC